MILVVLSGGKDEDEAAFHADRKRFLNRAFQVDKVSGLMIYVPPLRARAGAGEHSCARHFWLRRAAT